MDAVPLPGVDDRAEGDFGPGGVADGETVFVLGEGRTVVGRDGRVNDVAAGGHADLALVHEGPERPGGDGSVQVDVGGDDERRVTAELQVGTLEVLPGEPADDASGTGGTREGDHPYQRVRHQRLAYVSAARQYGQHPFGQPGLIEDAGQCRSAAHRRPRVRLEDDGVAQGQRRGDRPDREDEGDVEGRDHTHDLGRDTAGQADARLGAAQHLAGRV